MDSRCVGCVRPTRRWASQSRVLSVQTVGRQEPLCKRRLNREALERQRPPRTCSDGSRTAPRLPSGTKKSRRPTHNAVGCAYQQYRSCGAPARAQEHQHQRRRCRLVGASVGFHIAQRVIHRLPFRIGHDRPPPSVCRRPEGRRKFTDRCAPTPMRFFFAEALSRLPMRVPATVPPPAMATRVPVNSCARVSRSFFARTMSRTSMVAEVSSPVRLAFTRTPVSRNGSDASG